MAGRAARALEGPGGYVSRMTDRVANGDVVCFLDPEVPAPRLHVEVATASGLLAAESFPSAIGFSDGAQEHSSQAMFLG